MSFNTWLHNRRSAFAPGRRQRHHLRLSLERLEDRTVPSLLVGHSIEGIDSNSAGGWRPPDSNAAVGNDFVVETVNMQIRIFNKTTEAVLLDESLDSFFGVANFGDPYVVYDDIANHWYVSAFDGSESGLLLAVSVDGNPLHGFLPTYDLTNVGGFPDYAKMGFNKDAIFISYNDFGAGDPGPAAIASIDKTAALTGTLSYFVSHPDFQFRGMPPAQMHGDTTGGVEWFVSTDGTDTGGNTIRVTKLTNYLSNSPGFTRTSLAVTPYQSASQADQPGGTVTVFPNTTTYQVQYRNGHLVTAMASGTAADGFVYPKGLYYQIDVSGGTPTLLQQGVIDPGAGVAVQMPSVDEVSGNLGFTWIESSSSEYLSMWVGSVDTSGNFDSQVVAPGLSYMVYNDRIGDYSTTVLDPSDGRTFWSANEYVGSDGDTNPWHTHIASFTLGLGVASSTPARGSIVTTTPTSYVITFSDPVNAASVQTSDFTVTSDGISHAATGVTLDGTNTQATFTFDTDPVTIQGAQNMAIAAGAITRASDGEGILPFDATFRYDVVRMEVLSTNPPGPVAGVPLTTFDVNLNEAVDPTSVSESDLTLSQGTVTGVTLSADHKTIHFALSGITSEGTLDASIAAGALTDEFGNPNKPFASTYTLVTSMAVDSSTPAAGDIVSPTKPQDFVINFTLPYTLTGNVIDPGDLTVNDIPANSVSFDDADTVTFHFDSTPVTAEGVQTMHMAAGVVDADSSVGLPDPANIEWTATFRYDAVRMQVDSTTPAVGSSAQLPLTTFDVNLNEAVDPTSVSESDLTLSQGTVTGFTLSADHKTIHFALSGITSEGTLDASIAAGAFTDAFGNPNLAFAGSYTLDIGTVPYPTPLVPITPLGSLIYDPSYTASIQTSSDTDKFTLQVDAGQTITVIVNPSATLQPKITLTGPLAGSTTASGVGKEAVLQTVGVTTAGLYTIEVGSASGTTGQYTVQVFLNAAVELEAHDGSANNSPATAQNIDASFTPLLKGATRGAVMGSTDASNPTVTVFSANFESGTNGFVNTGLWHQSIGHRSEAGHSATQSLYFGTGEKYTQKGKGAVTFIPGTYEVKSKGKVLVEAGTSTSPNIVLPSGGQLTVDFNYLLQTQGSTTLDLAQLQISTNGTSWTTLASYNGVAESSVWRAANTVDVSAYAGQTVQLRFNFNTVNAIDNNHEGWYVDDVRVTQTIPHDNYSFTAKAGQYVSVALQTPGDVNVLLRSADGTTTYASGAAGAINVSKMIYNFGPLPTTGTYNLAITGQTNTPYTMVVLLDSVFDKESNDTSANAQPLGSTHVALGSLSNGDTVTLDATNSGWWDSTGTHDATNNNYIAGFTAGTAYHDFFVFDLAGVARQIASAELRIFNPSDGYLSPDSTETYTMFDISTSLAALQASGGGQTGIFNDLGTGSTYGSRVVSSADNGQVVSITLNAAGLAALNASIGTQVALGGALTTLAGGADQYIFGYSGSYSRQLVLTLADPADWYKFTANVGDNIVLYTATPGSGDGEFGNTLDPHIELFNPSGVKVEDTHIVLDGHGNEQITYHVPGGGAGDYKVKVTAENGTSGEYILDPIELPANVSARFPVARMNIHPVSSDQGSGISGQESVIASGMPAMSANSLFLTSTPAVQPGTVAVPRSGESQLASNISARGRLDLLISSTSSVSTLVDGPVAPAPTPEPELAPIPMPRATPPSATAGATTTDSVLVKPRASDDWLADDLWAAGFVDTLAAPLPAFTDTSTFTSSSLSALAFAIMLNGAWYLQRGEPEEDRRNPKAAVMNAG